MDIDNFDLQFEISNNLIGDLNSDLVINVIDAVILVKLILNSSYTFDADINMDNFLDILVSSADKFNFRINFLNVRC